MSDPIQVILCQTLMGSGGELDWGAFSSLQAQAIVKAARLHGVAPLLYAALKRLKVETFSDYNLLAAEYYKTAAQNALLMGEYDRLMQALAEAGVDAAPVKGMALIEIAANSSDYLDPALRPMNDIDLLVSPAQVNAATRVLCSCGYVLQKVTYHAVFFGGPGRSVTVELHWTLPGGAPFDPAQIHQPAFQFLYLAAHLILQHAADAPRLIWFYDLHLWLTHHRDLLDGDGVRSVRCELSELGLLKMAQALGWEDLLRQALAGLQARFSTWLPPVFLNQSASTLPGWSTTPAEASAVRSELQTTLDHQQSLIRRWMWKALTALPYAARLRMMVSFLFPDPEYLRWRYDFRPGWLWPLSYPRRWGEMAREGLWLVTGL